MAYGWLVGRSALLAHLHVLRQRDRHEPMRLQSVEGGNILGNRDLNPVVYPHPRPVFENPEHVVLLLQCLGIDLGPEVSRARHKRVSLAVQVGRVINGRLQVFRDWVAANEKNLAVFHGSQVVVLRHLSGRRIVRNRLRATREQCNQEQTQKSGVNANCLANKVHLTLLKFQLGVCALRDVTEWEPPSDTNHTRNFLLALESRSLPLIVRILLVDAEMLAYAIDRGGRDVVGPVR